MSAKGATQILEALGPSCRDSARRARLLKQSKVNGIDFVEFEMVGAHPTLHVHFLTDLPAGAYGLPGNLRMLRVFGGSRIADIAVVKVTRISAQVLDVEVDRQGDFSPYLLTIGWSGELGGPWTYALDEIDRPFSVAPINFRPDCPVDFDCASNCDCHRDDLSEPMLDYMARDYASFRQMLIDLVAQRNPTWVERSPADLGIVLLELFAYEGDQLSYFQDAVANEAYLDTARQRVSAKRHAKLVDYAMHDGRNAWAFVHYAVSAPGSVAAGRPLITRIGMPMQFDRVAAAPAVHPTGPPDPQLNFVADEDYRSDPALAQVRVFETATTTAVHPLNNELSLHTWGNLECCLPRGCTTAHVFAIDKSGAEWTAVRPPLSDGDYLLVEEVLGPENGKPADADPSHRVVVQIMGTPVPLVDPLFLAAVDRATGHLQERPSNLNPVPAALPLLQVRWRKTDALKFPLFLTAKIFDPTQGTTTQAFDISVARGNLGLADHGRTVIDQDLNLETFDLDPKLVGGSTFRLRLKQGPLTMQCQTAERVPPPFPPVRERTDLSCDVREARPAVAVRASRPGFIDDWWPVPDLLSSTPFKRHFVVDVDDLGRGVLRFGDGQYGERPTDVNRMEVWYRVGNGRSGNIGAEALAHIVAPHPLPLDWPGIVAIRNPLPALGGVDAERIEQVRHYAPAAFRASQYRAVTERDYRDAALGIAGVAGAVARFRWTGSWYTVFVGIDPADPEHVITNARGFARLDPDFEELVLDGLSRYRLAGYDLEIRSARYVPLDVAIQLCVKPGTFRSEVAHAVALVLASGVDAAGGAGFFDSSNFTFGQPVHLSALYAAVEKVEGVDSARVTVFQRHGRRAAGELESGELRIGDWEIARLENDPSNMENGTLIVTAGGGS